MSAAAFFAPTVAINVQARTVDAVVVMVEVRLRTGGMSRNLVEGDPGGISTTKGMCAVNELSDSRIPRLAITECRH